MNNPFARPPACITCNDTRMVTRRVEAREADRMKCPNCGNLNDDEYERFRRDAWIKNNKLPEIGELDMTAEEIATLRRMRADHPNVSKQTAISWIEGQRYDPAKDPEFLGQAREEFRKWRAR